MTRRVLAIADHSDARLALAVEHFGQAKPQHMEIIRLNFIRGPQDVSCKDFYELIRRILAEQCPTKPSRRFPCPPI